jgi:putative peptidoglycan lipid II flippase
VTSGAEATGRGGPSLARGAAAITIAATLSRITGFVRVVVVAAAMGTTFFANTYQTANSAPNLLFELLAAGVLTSVFVPTFVEHLSRGQTAAAWRAADALSSIAVAALAVVAAVLALAAPLVMRLLTVGVERPGLRAEEIAFGSDLLRLFAPQVVFYGLSMIMTAALHAHKRFALAAAAPILNNIVVTGVYLTYAAQRSGAPPSLGSVTTAQTVVLGAGTTLGVVVMTAVLAPQLYALGWRPRWRWEPHHPAVAKAARLGVWALGYAGGYQAGLIVVLLLANRVEGGVAAYQWAYTFFYVPHATLGVAIFNVLFPTLSEQYAKGDEVRFSRRLTDAAEMLAFVLLPVAMLLVVSGDAVAHSVLSFGAMTSSGAQLVGRTLAAFGLGLPAYSGFLAVSRAFYARGDARTPALVNAAAIAVSATSGAVLFAALGDAWSVPGLAAGHSLGFGLAAILGASLLRRRLPLEAWITPSVKRSALVTAAAGAAMVLARALVPVRPGLEALVSLAAIGLTGALVYIAGMRALGARELTKITSVLRRNPS